MSKVLEVRVQARPVPLTRASVQALQALGRYDLMVFTSKNARQLFERELEGRALTIPAHVRIIQVGPRRALLRYRLGGKRILFPRSALAPYDIVRALRARGAFVRTIRLYTATLVPLAPAELRTLRTRRYTAVSFTSPSGISGALASLAPKDAALLRALPARCIGATTAAAARRAGFTVVE